MPTLVPLSANRRLLSLYFERAKRFHAVSSTVCEFDVSELLRTLDALPAQNRTVDFNACVVKAVAQVLERHPKFNRHLFWGWGQPQVADFGEVSCNFMVLRKEPSGESILLPVVLRHANQASVEELTERIRWHRATPLEALPNYRTIARLKRLPGWVFHLVSYLMRSRPAFYIRYAGTFGVSSLVRDNARPGRREDVVSLTHSLATTGAGFFPCGLYAQEDAGHTRVYLVMACSFDHLLVDGHDVVHALEELRKELATPERLGLTLRESAGR